MLNSTIFRPLIVCLSCVFVFSCSGNQDDNEPVNEYELINGTLGTVEYFKKSAASNDYILINDAQSNRAYLMDKNAELIHEWSLSNNIGNDVFLLNDGKVLASLESDNPKMRFGGKGGKIQIIEEDNAIAWEFIYSSEDAETHHDVEMLPNGNIIALVWERKTTSEAEMAGSILGIDVYPEAIIEVNPKTNEIVWEWHAWDHLVQDKDASKSNFGIISENPHRIDVNYVTDKGGDIMHANGISYDRDNDLIFISVNFFSEIWVIDHSTTTEEAASNTGGNYNKGGDLIFRFGNPKAYQNSLGKRLFYNNHHPNLLQGNDKGKMLVFSNGGDLEQSTVYELNLPQHFVLKPNFDNEPEVIWSFTDPDLYSARVSGAVRLSNGNTLITEGDFGIWEVTENGDIVWKFYTIGFFWRTYNYERSSNAISQLGLN